MERHNELREVDIQAAFGVDKHYSVECDGGNHLGEQTRCDAANLDFQHLLF